MPVALSDGILHFESATKLVAGGGVVAPPAAVAVQLILELPGISIRIAQPALRQTARALPWLDLWMTLKRCPQPPVGGVLGSTLPPCVYMGAAGAAAAANGDGGGAIEPVTASVLTAGVA